MTYRTYLLSFDPTRPDLPHVRVVEFVRVNFYTYQLYALVPGTVFIKSTANLLQLHGTLHNFMSPTTWTITEFHHVASSLTGSAPSDFWAWVNNDSPPPLEHR